MKTAFKQMLSNRSICPSAGQSRKSLVLKERPSVQDSHQGLGGEDRRTQSYPAYGEAISIFESVTLKSQDKNFIVAQMHTFFFLKKKNYVVMILHLVTSKEGQAMFVLTSVEG